MVTHTVERLSSRQLVILQALVLGLVALVVAALVGEWEFGLALGAAVCLGRLATLVWRRKT